MPIKNLTLGICLLLAAQALAQNNTHIVRKGDSITALATYYRTTPKAILKANGLKDQHKLHLGQKLVIPNVASITDRNSEVQVPRTESAKNGSKTRVPGADAEKAGSSANAGSYTVKEGDNDYIIANRLGTTVASIHRLNPGLNWNRIQIGQKLNVPGTDSQLHTDRSSVRDADANQPSIFQALSEASPKPEKEERKYYMVAAESPQEKVIKTARSFRGVRYRWGGMSRSGTDCSGFTSQVFRAQGVKLPRTSVEQARVGAKVKGDLQAGDLVFFKTTRAARISHVGIYIGKGKFIHASSGGGRVQINSLREGYYRSRFVTARRVVKAWKGTPLAKQAADIVQNDPDPKIVLQDEVVPPPSNDGQVLDIVVK